jgi:hypothetical protein
VRASSHLLGDVGRASRLLGEAGSGEDARTWSDVEGEAHEANRCEPMGMVAAVGIQPG